MYFLMSLIITGICACYMPEWLYGLEWKDLIDIWRGRETDALETFLKYFGIIDKTTREIAGEKILIIALIIVAVFIVMLIITTFLKKAMKKLD